MRERFAIKVEADLHRLDEFNDSQETTLIFRTNMFKRLPVVQAKRNTSRSSLVSALPDAPPSILSKALIVRSF